MSLLQELLEISKKTHSQLNENDELQQKLQDLFGKADEEGNLQPYVKNETIQARPAQEDEEVQITFPGETHQTAHAKLGEYVVRDTENPNSIKLMSKHDLENDYELEKSDSKPDAEGFTSYRPKGQILAFEYNEHEPLELKDERGHIVHVKFGDYLGYPIDDETVLIQLDKTHFEQSYRSAE